MLQEINFMTIIVTIAVIAIIGGFWKAILAINNFLDKYFVRKTYCLTCQADMKSEIYKDSNNKYEKVQEQIQKNHDEWTKEIKDIRKEASERGTILARMEGKIDTLLGDKK